MGRSERLRGGRGPGRSLLGSGVYTTAGSGRDMEQNGTTQFDVETLAYFARALFERRASRALS